MEVLAGRYIKIGLNSFGTLGTDGSNPPGILYDGTGTETFNPDYDYLTPGTPFEGFALSGFKGGVAFSAFNNNDTDSGTDVTVDSFTLYNGVNYTGAGNSYENRAVWTGTYAGFFTITHDYHFNERLIPLRQALPHLVV